jgi:protein SCO1
MRAAPRLALALMLAGCSRNAPEPPPVLESLPAFALVDQTGRAIGPDELRGEPFVANFIFTRCVSACPLLTSQMINLQKRLGDDADRVKMVSISVDPAHDTPEVLARYAEERGATRRWLHLTGDVDEVKRTIEKGFRVRMGERVPLGDAFDILHASHFVLVDSDLRIRGYHRNDAEGLDELLDAIRALLRS